MRRAILLLIVLLAASVGASAANSIAGNCGTAGATVYWVGGISGGVTNHGRVVADGSGNYTTTVSLTNGTYQITCYATGFTFSPAFSIQTISGSNITGVNFTASAIGTTGVWVRKGIVIYPNLTDLNNYAATSGNEEITGMYEGNPHLISPNADGKVFKLWFACGVNVCYAEANNGIQYTRQVSPAITGVGNPRVFEDGGTYYLFGTTGASGGNINRYTSADGTAFTLTNSAVLTPGAAGTWDAAQVWDLHVVQNMAGTWDALYTANAVSGANNQFNEGHATSIDQGVTWTKDIANNPVLINLFSPDVHKISGTYWAWGTTSVFLNNPNQPFAIPSEGGRASSSNLVNWTGVSNVFQRTLPDEGANTAANGQSGTYGTLVEALGQVFYYYTTSSSGQDGLNFGLQCAVFNGTLAQLVSTNEQVNQTAHPITLVQKAGTNNGNVSTGAPVTLAYPSNNTTGDLLVFTGRLTSAVVVNMPPTTVSITDTQGNTWHPLTNFTLQDSRQVMYYVENCAGGADTVSVQASGGGASAWFYTYSIAEYSGILTSGSLDQTATGTGTSQFAATANLFTTKPNELLVSGIFNETANGLTLQPGPGLAIEQNPGNNNNGGLQDGLVFLEGSYQANMHFSSSVNWGASVASFIGQDQPALSGSQVGGFLVGP